VTLRRLYDRLYALYGSQRWWPAESPFEVMVGAILTQNTAWTNVERAIANLRANDALSAGTIATAERAVLAEWLRPSGYYNIKAGRLQRFCRWYQGMGGYRVLAQMETAPLRRALLSVNGVGYETADDMLLYAFHRPVFVVDAYTRRLFSRLGLADAESSYEALRHQVERALVRCRERVALFNEYHALIVAHAKAVCRKRPLCRSCALTADCPAAGEV